MIETTVDDVASATLLWVDDTGKPLGTGTAHASRTMGLQEDAFSFRGGGQQLALAWGMHNCTHLLLEEDEPGSPTEAPRLIDSSRSGPGTRYNRPGHSHGWINGHMENLFDWLMAQVLLRLGEKPEPTMVSFRFLHALQCQLAACVASANTGMGGASVEVNYS